MARRSPVRIALLNDHPLVVEGLHAMLAPYAERVVIVDVSVDAPAGAAVDVVLYDTFGAETTTAHWSRFLGDGWDPRYVVLYTWGQTSDPTARSSEGAPPALQVSKGLDGEALVDVLEQIDATGTYRPRAGYAEAGRGPDGDPKADPDGDPDGDTDAEQDTVRTWPGKAEGLTERESEIVFLIVEGLSNIELAERLFLGINTVKTYIRSAYRRMGVTSRSNAVLWGIDHGFRRHRPPY